jgi:hypothetical protein
MATIVALMVDWCCFPMHRCPRHGSCEVFATDYYCVKCERKALVSEIRQGDRLPPPSRLRRLLLALHDEEEDSDSDPDRPAKLAPAPDWKKRLGGVLCVHSCACAVLCSLHSLLTSVGTGARCLYLCRRMAPYGLFSAECSPLY